MQSRKEPVKEINAGNQWYVSSQFAWAEKKEIRPIYKARFKFFLSTLNKVKARNPFNTVKVLDLGCGDGYWSRVFSDLDGVQITAVDYNPLRIKRAKENAPNAYIIQADLYKFELLNKFDIIWLSQVLEHIPDDELILKKVQNFLSPNGFLIVGVPNEGSFLHQRRINKLIAKNGNYETDHVHFYTENALKKKLLEAGYIVRSTLREPFFCYSERLFYFLMRRFWGRLLLNFFSTICPSECSDFYLACQSFDV